MSANERFEIRFVDNDARLYVLVASAELFIVACYARDILRAERGGDWIILDAHTGRCVADTRPHEPISEEDVEARSPLLASVPVRRSLPDTGECARDATTLRLTEARPPAPVRRAKPSKRRAAVNVDD